MSATVFPKNCTLKVDFYNKEDLCTRIFVSFLDEKVYIENFTDYMIHRAFGVNENPTMDDFNDFLEDRCYSRNRADIKEILKTLGLQFYDPLGMCEITKGRTHEDSQWMDFEYKALEGWSL